MNPVTIGSTRHQPPAEAQVWFPSCDGAGWAPDAMDGSARAICPDYAGSGRGEHSITVNKAQAQGGGEVEYARRLAVDLWQRHYREVAPEWEPFRDLAGLLSQIDNMASGLCRFDSTAPPSAPVGVEGLMQLARNWCLTWGEWAHDADPGGAKENAAEAELRAALTAALAQQPAACPKCNGTGEADSGGIMPWGAPATIPCDFQQPAPAAVEGELMAAIDAGDWEGPKQTVGADLYGARVCISVPPGERPPAAYVYTAPPPAPAAVAGGDAEEDAYVIDALAHLLAEISIIVNGPEPAGTKWSYHDLPEKVAELKRRSS